MGSAEGLDLGSILKVSSVFVHFSFTLGKFRTLERCSVLTGSGHGMPKSTKFDLGLILRCGLA